MERITTKSPFIIGSAPRESDKEDDSTINPKTSETASNLSMKEEVESESLDSPVNKDQYFELIVNEDDQSFSFSKSDKFDSEVFLKSVLKGLKKIKDKSFKHNLKLFICKAFRIPMNSLEPDLVDSDFIDALKDEVSTLDVNPELKVGAVGLSSDGSNKKGDSLEEDLEALQI
jgi:hypothetical protein